MEQEFEHNGKWQSINFQLVDGREYQEAYIWLDPNKRTSDMLNNSLHFISVLWDSEFFCVNKTYVLWVTEQK